MSYRAHILYSFIHLKGDDRPRYVGCDEDITVKYILLDCVDFSDQRLRFYLLPNLKHLFTYTVFHEHVSTFFLNKISLPERRNKRKSVLEITKMYYFKI